MTKIIDFCSTHERFEIKQNRKSKRTEILFDDDLKGNIVVAAVYDNGAVETRRPRQNTRDTELLELLKLVAVL